MKTKNSTKWSKLYLTELKCELSVGQSLLALEIFLFILLLALSSIIFIEVEQAVLAWQFVGMLILVLYLIWIFSDNWLKKQKQLQPIFQGVLDSYRGVIADERQSFQILPSSKIAFYGYYLSLAPIKQSNLLESTASNFSFISRENNSEIITLLVDKRSLSALQRACLNYAVLKQQAASRDALK